MNSTRRRALAGGGRRTEAHAHHVWALPTAACFAQTDTRARGGVQAPQGPMPRSELPEPRGPRGVAVGRVSAGDSREGRKQVADPRLLVHVGTGLMGAQQDGGLCPTLLSFPETGHRKDMSDDVTPPAGPWLPACPHLGCSFNCQGGRRASRGFLPPQQDPAVPPYRPS